MKFLKFCARFSYIRSWGLIATILLLLLFSCQVKQDARPAENGPDSTVAMKGKQELQHIRFLPKWLHQAQFAGVYMAKRKGFYQKRGLDVEIQYGGPSHSPHQSLIEGYSDITYLNLITALTKHSPEHPLVNLAQIAQKNSTLLVGKKRDGLNSIRDITAEKKIGVWRGESGDLVRLLLTDMDWDAEVVPIDWSVNLLLSDAIDLMNAMNYNEFHRVLMAGLDLNDLFVVDFGDLGYDLADDGLYTTLEYYQLNQQACNAFAEATMDGWIYALNHPKETLNEVLRIMRQYHLPANRAHQNWMLNKVGELVLANPGKIGYLAESDFNTAQDLLLKHKLISQRVDYQGFYPHAISKR